MKKRDTIEKFKETWVIVWQYILDKMEEITCKMSKISNFFGSDNHWRIKAWQEAQLYVVDQSKDLTP